jgi:hypothetical protein
VWLDHAAQATEGKLGSDGTAGFIAYANDSTLFVKTFADVPSGDAAEGEAEIELYVKPGEYVEVEQQGAARELGVGDSLTYSLKWYVRRLGSDVDVSPGSQALLDFAKQVGDL